MESACFSSFVLLVLSGCSRIFIEGLWTSNLVGQSSVGPGWKLCLHSKFIPSSNLDCMFGWLGEGWGRLQRGWVWKLYPNWLWPCWPKAISISNFLNSLQSSVTSFLSTSGCWLYLLRSLTSWIPRLLQRPGLQVLANSIPSYFWPDSSLQVHPSLPSGCLADCLLSTFGHALLSVWSALSPLTA